MAKLAAYSLFIISKSEYTSQEAFGADREQEILKDFPDLEQEDFKAVYKFAANHF